MMKCIFINKLKITVSGTNLKQNFCSHGMSNRKPYQDLGSDTSSVWKISYFCTCSSDVILERNSNGIVKCWLFSRAFALVSYHIAKKWPIPPPKSRMIFPTERGMGYEMTSGYIN